MITFATLGDLLKRRYYGDFIAQAQQLSSPIYSMLKEDRNFAGTGDGVYFPIRLAGNESGIGYRATDDNTLPTAGNEQIKTHRVRPKKLYAVCEFSGLAQAIAKGGEDSFANAITDALSSLVRRVGAVQEVTFLRSDGTGRLTNVSGTQASVVSVSVDDARPFRNGQVVVFLNNSTGLKSAGPVTITNRSISGGTITVSSAVSVTDDDGVYINGEQSEAAPPAEVTPLGLPAIVNSTGTIYNLSRTTHPILQAQSIAAGSVALDESLLRRLRKRLMVETDVGSMAGFVYVTNHEQFDRYTEIALGFRRFNDMTLELGAKQEMTTFEGRPFVISWAAIPDEIYMIRMDAIVRGVVRPLSIDENVNFSWVPGQDALCTLLKSYHENVARIVNQCGRITGLTNPTY